jgi:long-chain acyl-CoA synthetase
MLIETSDLLLERAYRWEREMPKSTFMTQPMGDGSVRTYSWERTLDEARRIAAYLQSYGFPPGTKIAILSKNCAHFIMTDLAVWMAGYVSVALYPTLQASTVRHILEHSESKLLFVGKLDDWSSMAPGVPDGMPRITYPLSPKSSDPTWEDLVRTTQPIAGTPRRTPDDTAILVYTSGSTGTPKGVEHSFRNLAAAGKGFCQALAITPAERMLSYLPLAHVFERGAVEALSLYVGNQVFFADSLDTFVADLQRARPTVFHSVPRLWLKFQQGVHAKMHPSKLKKLLRIPIISGLVRKKILVSLGLSDARLAVSGSAPIPPELIQWYRDLGLELLEGYGMSENFAYSHVSLRGKSRVGYVGNNLPGVDTRISPEGEVQVKSPTDMKGYYREPELTRASFTEDGYLRTGDRGEIDSEGRLRLTGRLKELFKTSKGKYVVPVPIENLLNADSHVELAFVSGSGRPAAYAVVQLADWVRSELKSGAKDSAYVEQVLTRLIQHVNEQIEEHEQLAFIAVAGEVWQVENGFLTPTLKLIRGKAEAVYTPRADAWYEGRRKVYAGT